MSIEYRRMTLADLDAVDAIERATFPHPWSRADYERELTTNQVARYLVAVEDGQVLGFAGAWVILDESHITNVAVEERQRGRGIGKGLMQALLQYLSNLGAAYATLEVRESNAVAIHVYKALGFYTVSVRKKYYEDNGEDALLMVCPEMPEASPDFEEEETLHEG